LASVGYIVLTSISDNERGTTRAKSLTKENDLTDISYQVKRKKENK